LECGGFVPKERMRYRAKFCSKECQRGSISRKYRELNPDPFDLPTSTVGAVAELRVAADLLNRGYEVFRALSPSTSCDLAVLKDGILHRVEVRTGHIKPNGELGYHVKLKDNGRQDIYAVVRPNEIHYIPPLPS